MGTKANKIINSSNFQNDFKFKISIILCIFVHTFIAIFSLLNNITPLFIFNLGSIATYILTLIILKHSQTLVVYISFLEIILHSFVCTILIGNGFGFVMYFIALVPMSYHFLHSIRVSHYLRKASAISIASFIMYVTCYVISYYNEPLYQSDTLNNIKIYVYLINMFFTFVILAYFSLFFIAETEAAIKKLYSKNKELDVLANKDPLTGLYNRRTMTEHVVNMCNESKENNTEFSLIICDIDDFKRINDNYGHDFGDEVLKTIAGVLSSLTRGHDFLCRWGGEEFLILLKNIDYNMAKTIAERIRVQIEKTNIIYNDIFLNITMTFGVASSTQTNNYNSLFKLADERLYEGKRSGKNKVV